jgi:hypothetical protein
MVWSLLLALAKFELLRHSVARNPRSYVSGCWMHIWAIATADTTILSLARLARRVCVYLNPWMYLLFVLDGQGQITHAFSASCHIRRVVTIQIGNTNR